LNGALDQDDAIARRLLPWFERHGRHDLPWQSDGHGGPPGPYRVWVSEIMLQQTQVATAEGYFLRFMERFPDLVSLAAADIDEVLAVWAGLGYYARARNLHRCGRLLVDEQEGRFPRDLAGLCALPGIGRSTAGAILSLGHGIDAAILDGNVKRVLARLFRVAGWPGRSATQKRLWALAERFTPAGRSGAYNQAMMDLGATLCRRGQADCPRCPLQDICSAHGQGDVARFPEPRPRRARPLRQCWMLLHRREDGAVLLQQRPPQGIWGGLWSLPEQASVEAAEDWQRRHLGAVWTPERQEQDCLLHRFSHFDLSISLLHCRVPSSAPSAVAEGAGLRWVPADRLPEHALPAPVSRLLARR